MTMTAAPPATDIKETSFWICPKGHRNETWLIYDGELCLHGSAWDFCNHCDVHPSAAEFSRMTLEITGKWLRADKISVDEYHQLSESAVNMDIRPTDPSHSILGLPYRPHRRPLLTPSSPRSRPTK